MTDRRSAVMVTDAWPPAVTGIITPVCVLYTSDMLRSTLTTKIMHVGFLFHFNTLCVAFMQLHFLWGSICCFTGSCTKTAYPYAFHLKSFKYFSFDKCEVRTLDQNCRIKVFINCHFLFRFNKTNCLLFMLKHVKSISQSSKIICSIYLLCNDFCSVQLSYLRK